MRRRSRTAQDTLADASAYAAELIGAVRTLQAFTNGRSRAAGFGSRRARLSRRESSRPARAFLTAIIIFLASASVVVVLWVGAQDVIAGKMTPGRLSQFVLFAVFAASGLGQLSEVWGGLSQAAGSAERLMEFLAIEPEIRAPAQPWPCRSARAPRSPSRRCASPIRRGRKPTCSTASRSASSPARRSRSSAPRGRARARSSTDPALLRSEVRRVTFDGVRLPDADPAELRRHIALVPQDTAIFAMSVRDNIRFGRPDATDAEIERRPRRGRGAVIRALPQGYDTPVGERGVTLSGGQRQRIAIARAILRQAPLLLLDEATSSLDAESETLVQAALRRLMTGRTTLVIAHRLATVLSCDRILVLDQGRIVEEGTHDSLVARDGLYARLAKLQFETA